eukprot:TRINITY_DN172_c0_g1_i9.p1 TRINITY_DN172_c0_g1~~TRINITY_DN172_c0_g1_i9.p1  ORF type:complete len:122 (-),score=21.48 TRINITY_DN172_c0_g1_i9:45-410(-)
MCIRDRVSTQSTWDHYFMGAKLTIEIDIDPASKNLVEISLRTAGGGPNMIIRQADLRKYRKGEDVVWTGLGFVWYDIYLKDVTGHYPYCMRGKYLTRNTIVRMSHIIRLSLIHICRCRRAI